VDERVELIGGAERREIRIVDHDPAWPERFARERERIAAALSPVARRIDHIGSTAVPGLAAKAIVDIQISVPDVEDEPSYLDALLAAGYRHRVREPGHRMVRTPRRDVHVHICASGGEWERRHLLLRDWLRRDRADRESYQRLKRELARGDWADMNDYADAKGPLIAEMTRRAEAWARSSGWAPGAGDARDLSRRAT
jgi:GrpB-like predicted nucleotidyltransferase (UPF0157 family)